MQRVKFAVVGAGALATVNVSDAIAAPRSWELTSGENPAYVNQAESCCPIGGALGSLAIPQLEIWTHWGERSWTAPMRRERIDVVAADPSRRQIRHFRDVIRGEASPLACGAEGLATLRVLEAIRRAAATGARTRVLSP